LKGRGSRGSRKTTIRKEEKPKSSRISVGEKSGDTTGRAVEEASQHRRSWIGNGLDTRKGLESRGVVLGHKRQVK